MANMFGFMADLTETDFEIKEIMEAVKEAAKTEILVGIPEEKNGRAAEGSVAVTNAELLYIHTNGSPINNIPARPVIEPALKHDKEKVSTLLKGVADAALTGNKQKVLDAAEKAGMQAANIARAWFTNPANGWAENSDSTINGVLYTYKRDGVNKKTGKTHKAGDTVVIFKGKGSSRPLIDTGEMRKSITYKIKGV